MTDPAPSILLGIPCTQDGLQPEFVSSLLALDRRCRELGWHLDVQMRTDGMVTRTRNLFASEVARNSRYTHLLMIDSDIGFDPTVVERLVNSGHQVVGACVPLREVRFARLREYLDRTPNLDAQQMESIAHGYAVAFLPKDAEGRSRTAVRGFLRVRYLGGALLLVRRDALVALADSDHVVGYDSGAHWRDWPASGWTFFDPAVDEDGTYLSEDFAFCHRWAAAGGETWVDLRSQVSHVGIVRVHGDVDLTMQTGAQSFGIS